MAAASSIEAFTEAVADAVTAVGRTTAGQYGDELGSEDKERQLELLLDHPREADDRYEEVDREVAYPDGRGKCAPVPRTRDRVEVNRPLKRCFASASSVGDA